MPTPKVEAGPVNAGPALTGSDDDALVQALRNLWPILSDNGRTQAINTVRGTCE